MLDTLIVGLFASVGTNAALLAGLNLLPSILIGTIASVGGLITADLLQGRPSSIMYQGPPEAVAGLAGAVAYALLYNGTRPVITTTIAVVATVAVRLSGPLFHVTVPQPRKHAYEVKLRRASTSRPGAWLAMRGGCVATRAAASVAAESVAAAARARRSSGVATRPRDINARLEHSPREHHADPSRDC